MITLILIIMIHAQTASISTQAIYAIGITETVGYTTTYQLGRYNGAADQLELDLDEKSNIN